MSIHSREFGVYSRLIEDLIAKNWHIVCASPPGGTDNRFRKCLLPRRDLAGSIRGPRDEVDVTAHDGTVILLAECKPRLSDSFSIVNALGESDYEKLKRLLATFTPSRLAELLVRGTGHPVPPSPLVAPALVVEEANWTIPIDMTVIELKPGAQTLWVVEPLLGRL
jgi:hypothetical protein